MNAPKVFISYSHDSDDHKSWVKKLASDLRSRGVDASLDQWDLRPGQDVAAFMQNGVSKSDRVLMICSERYVEKAEKGSGGVGYERLIVTAEVVAAIDTIKFIPIMRECRLAKVPNFLGARYYLDFRNDTSYSHTLNELCRDLLDIPSDKPPLGPALSSRPPEAADSRQVGSTGRTARGKSILEEQWFEEQDALASKGLHRLKLTGAMEIRFGLQEEINKSQIELLEGVREAQIHTFGWPISVLIENNAEWKPKPVTDGIRAEVALDSNTSPSGRHSFDYWAARNTGDYYLLQSLFEDTRAANSIFFDTRIVRVTEALLFATRLYERLGVDNEARLFFRVGHRGLGGRSLASANPNRIIRPVDQCATTEHRSERVVRVGDVRKELVEHVEGLLAPLFVLFGFTKLQTAIFEDIVRRFERGEVR